MTGVQTCALPIFRRVGGIGTTGVGLLFDGGPGIGKTTHAVVSAMEFVRRLPEDDNDAQRVLAIKSSDYGMPSCLTQIFMGVIITNTA